jgi:hypothetical protein
MSNPMMAALLAGMLSLEMRNPNFHKRIVHGATCKSCSRKGVNLYCLHDTWLCKKCWEKSNELIDFVKMVKENPKVIKTWEELKGCTSDTHYLEIFIDLGYGYIHTKGREEKDYKEYLSTHTFYSGTHKESTEILRLHGFNVKIIPWEDEND